MEIDWRGTKSCWASLPKGWDEKGCQEGLRGLHLRSWRSWAASKASDVCLSEWEVEQEWTESSGAAGGLL